MGKRCLLCDTLYKLEELSNRLRALEDEPVPALAAAPANASAAKTIALAATPANQAKLDKEAVDKLTAELAKVELCIVETEKDVYTPCPKALGKRIKA